MKVALITEGVTDQFVLKPIVECILEDDDISFNSLQPLVDEEAIQVGFGGWELVFKTIRALDIALLLEINDFVIVQIDSDMAHMKGFDVPQAISGSKVDAADLCQRVIDRLKGILPQTISDEQLSKFVFAIGIHSIECWLIGLVDAAHGPKVIGNCLDGPNGLNSALAKGKHCSKWFGAAAQGQPCKIIEKTKNKGQSRKIYQELAKQFSKRKILVEQSKRNTGFEYFVEQLQSVQGSMKSKGQN
jgi:hypothetical protein